MAILQEVKERIKNIPQGDWLIIIVLVLTATLSFGLGRLSALYGGGGELQILYPENQAAAVIGAAGVSESEKLPPSDGGYVASKAGSKYHLPWCPGAQSIKEENKIYFNTKEEAEARGYTPAANCKGI